VGGDQRAGVGELPRRGGVVDGLLDLAATDVPGRGPAVQGRDQRRFAVAELQAQQLAEQLVVAVPPAVVVQRHQEQVYALYNVVILPRL
jgi:hypothetical protein